MTVEDAQTLYDEARALLVNLISQTAEWAEVCGHHAPVATAVLLAEAQDLLREFEAQCRTNQIRGGLRCD